MLNLPPGFSELLDNVPRKRTLPSENIEILCKIWKVTTEL